MLTCIIYVSKILDCFRSRPTDEAGGLMGYFGKALSPSSYLPVHVSMCWSLEHCNRVLPGPLSVIATLRDREKAARTGLRTMQLGI